MPSPEVTDVSAVPLAAALARPPVFPTELARLRRWLREVHAALAAGLDDRVRAIRSVLVVFDARLDAHADALTSQATQIAALEARANRALPVAALPASAVRGALFQLAGDASLYMGQGPGQPLVRFAPAVTT